eukprot:TRINITY_DN66144_c0_g1_i1.p2 TRINITY_DN66144_c0_g1~~TRINITY_DN66144_c0_g1_i1.p2  ORF type:complete len:206 (+),score=51.30 TRINITY_DN66144_c0_g1_i1:100-717(+)
MMAGQLPRFNKYEINVLSSMCLSQWNLIHTDCLPQHQVAASAHGHISVFDTAIHSRLPFSYTMFCATWAAVHRIGSHNAWAAAACSVVLFQRLRKAGMPIHLSNLHRIGLVCFFIALKTHYDSALPVSFLVDVAWMTGAEVREAERIILTRLGWDVLVSRRQILPQIVIPLPPQPAAPVRPPVPTADVRSESPPSLTSVIDFLTA